MNEVRVGLVGAGFMGEAHATCFRQDPRVSLGRVAAGRAESAARYAARFGIPHHSGRWQDVIEDAAIDAVDIVAPNDVHAEVAIAAAKSGKAVWTNRYDGPANKDDAVRGVATDSAGNVFVTGQSWTGTNFDWVTIKYAASEPVTSPALNIQRLGGNIVLSWTNAAFGLQSAPAITGPFTNLPAATSPYTNAPPAASGSSG